MTKGIGYVGSAQPIMLVDKYGVLTKRRIILQDYNLLKEIPGT